MSDISISSGSIEATVADIISKIQTEIIDKGTESGNAIVAVIENSSGDFINSLKETVTNETNVISSVGELLIAMANYIQAAADAFAYVDAAYDSSKIS